MKYGPITIRGSVPSKANSYKIISFGGHASLAKTPATKDYETNFYIQNPLRDVMIKGYFKIWIKVFFGSLSHDIDNSAKVILDCLQLCKTIKNDNRCVGLYMDKFVDKDNPRVEFTIEEVEL